MRPIQMVDTKTQYLNSKRPEIDCGYTSSVLDSAAYINGQARKRFCCKDLGDLS